MADLKKAVKQKQQQQRWYKIESMQGALLTVGIGPYIYCKGVPFFGSEEIAEKLRNAGCELRECAEPAASQTQANA